MVIDAKSGHPVLNANVVTNFDHRSFGQAAAPLRTDENGLVLISGQNVLAGGLGIWSADHAPVEVILPGFAEHPSPLVTEYTVKLEHGILLGGTLRDEAGRPLPNVHVTVTGLASNQDAPPPRVQEHPFYEPAFNPGAKTDAAGHWACAHFPSGLEALRLDFQGEDGAFASFRAIPPAWSATAQGELIDLETARRGDLVCVLKRGTDVRGTVVDASGKPLAGITVTETDWHPVRQPVSVSQTGADGRFLLPNRGPHQLLLTLTGAGFALKKEIVTVAPGMPELELRMHPAVPLRIRVMNEAGRAQGGMAVETASELYAWSGVTDAGGWVAREDAPPEPLLYHARSRSYNSFDPESFASGMARLQPDGSGHVIIVRKKPRSEVAVKIKATDEAGAALETFAVSLTDLPEGQSPEGGDWTEKLGQGGAGVFLSRIETYNLVYRDLRLKIEAPGRETRFGAAPLREDSEDQDLTFVLRKVGDAPITLRLPDGQPAAAAEVAVQDGSRNLGAYTNLRCEEGGEPKIAGQRNTTLRTDEKGRVKLPASMDFAPVVVLHGGGYLITTVGQLRQAPETRLTAWARLEGAVKVDGHPLAGQWLLVDYNLPSGAGVDYSIVTDQAGRFVFNKFPAGRFTMYCTEPSQGNWPRSHPTNVETAAGRTSQLAYNIDRGRAVTGKAEFIPADAELDWQRDAFNSELSYLSSGLPAKLPPGPVREDYILERDFSRALRQYEQAHQNQSGSSYASYKLQFDAEGKFRAEHIPPGKYELRVNLFKASHENGRWHFGPRGFLTRTVDVPAARAEDMEKPVELGNSRVEVKMPADVP